MIMVKGPVIELANVPPVVRMGEAGISPDLPEKLEEALGHFESRFIELALKKKGWNLSLAAELLGINRKTLQDKIKKFNILVQKNS